jgi:hypothetical protein
MQIKKKTMELFIDSLTHPLPFLFLLFVCGAEAFLDRD